MTQKQCEKILRQRFARLTTKEREHLAYHAERGTRICCGDSADLYVDGQGGG